MRAGVQPLSALRPNQRLTAADVLGLCLALSRHACATRLPDATGIAAVTAVLAAPGGAATSARADHEAADGPLIGLTSAGDALRLIAASRDEAQYPLTARALRHTAHGARIPLGATAAGITVTHKTGTLAGVAHDVAVLECRDGTLAPASLRERRHDLLVSGCQMGICTRGLLQAWGLCLRRTRSLL